MSGLDPGVAQCPAIEILPSGSLQILKWQRKVYQGRIAVSPERLAEILRKRREHDVEADANSFVLARIGVNGVL